MNKIAIHSVPRSGSTWLGEIFNSHPEVIYKYQPLFSYAFKDRLTPYSSIEDINLFFEEIAESDDDFLNQSEARENGKMPIFKKNSKKKYTIYKEVRYNHILENLLQKDKNIRIVGLIRNPMAVIYSWLNAPKEFRKELGWVESEEWRFANKKNLNKPEEYNGFEKWKEVANLFIRLEKTYPEQFKIISYSELLKDTLKVVSEAFSFCDIPLTDETMQFINKSKTTENIDPYSVYKTKEIDNSWQNGLDFKIASMINEDLKGTILEKYL